MRNFLKKICLCAALAALLAGLCAASAEFSDESLITYKTPVGVMHGAGILSGYTDGTFNPTGSITREEAVKMVAFAVLGEQGVKELSREDPGFTDVSAESWSAPYICWAIKNGVIAGVGGGAFNPTGEVTGYQLVKMMLCAAGYGQGGEYSGPSWEITAARDGFAKGFFANIVDADPSRSVTREEAALYIFNGITRLEQVAYDKDTEKYLPKDGTEALDNTIAAQIYGIVEATGKETVFHGVVIGNAVTGETGITVVGDRSFAYSTGFELIGRQVVVYTNGAEGLKNRVYYIGEESQTITLKDDINRQKRFEEVFGENFKISEKLAVYNNQALLTESTKVEGLDPDNGMAPAGSYVIYDGRLISYIAPVPQYAALVEKLDGASITISGVQYGAAEVVGCDSCKLGDVVLSRTLSDRLFVTPARTYTGRLTNIEKDSEGNAVYVFGTVVFVKSTVEDNTGVKSVEPVVGSYYTVFYDESVGYITIVNGQ